jgi:hypothetical protein
MTWFDENCPRLAKATSDFYRHREYERQIERNRTTALLGAQRLLAHRELQLVRAFNTRDPKYIRRREQKLRAARSMVNRLESA